MRRYPYNLGHLIASTGHIGRLMGLTQLPVYAGDSLSIDFGAVLRLSALRRNLTLDAQVDICVFYVPHRHVYGDRS